MTTISNNPPLASVLTSLGFLCGSNPSAVYHALNAAIVQAMQAGNIEVAAYICDLRKGLTGNWVPNSIPSDELRAIAGV